MLCFTRNNSYVCIADRYGVATYRQGEAYTPSASLFCKHHYNVSSMNTKEIWKPVVGYEGLYEVSNFGRVKSVERFVWQGTTKRKVKEKIKSQVKNTNGYPSVSLCANGRSKVRPIHILIANAFIPKPENKPYIDHINTNKEDYSISNLRWVTPKENSNNPITLTRCIENSHTEEAIQKSLHTKRERNTKTAPKEVFMFTLDGEFVAKYSSAREAQRCTGILNSEINSCCRCDKRSAGGFLWSRTNVPPEYNPYKTKQKKVAQYTKDMQLVKEWDSIKEASNTLKLCESNISRCAKGDTSRTLCGGYIWKYIL